MAVINPIPPLPPRTEALPAPLTGGVYLTVGPNKMFRSIGKAVLASHTNDVIAVDAVDGVGAHLTYNVQDDQTTYTNYHPQLNQSQLRLYSIGGMATWCSTIGANIINSAGLLFAEGGAHVFGFELCNSNNLQDHTNYTTIRTVNGDQTARFCYIHDNADGILGDSLGGRYLVDYCELDNNGVDNFSHNLYLGPTTITVVSNTWSRRCFEGHLVKSRAASTIVRNCILTQENSASNFVVDCGNAGNLIVENCVIQQSFNASNGCSIHYGGEGTSNASYAYLPNQLVVRGNTFIDNYGDFFNGSVWVNSMDMDNPAYVACVNNTNADPKWNGVAVNVTGIFEDNLLWHVANAQIVGAGGAPVTVSNNGTLDNAPTWSTVPPWTYAPTYLPAPSVGPLTIDLAANQSNDIVVYACDLPLSITINSPASGVNVHAPTGSVGFTVTNTGGDNGITTAAGTPNTIAVTGGTITMTSAGNDTVTFANGLTPTGSSIVSTGTLSVTSGTSPTVFTLTVNGGTTTVNCAYVCYPTVGASGTLVLTSTFLNAGFNVPKAAGGVAQLTAVVTGPVSGTIRVAGGAGAILTNNFASGVTYPVYTTSTDTAGQTLTYGAGTNGSTVGTGPNTFIFNSGTVTTTNITGFNTSPKDTITLHGYAGSPVVTHPSGNTVATLSDGSVITFVGVNITVP